MSMRSQSSLDAPLFAPNSNCSRVSSLRATRWKFRKRLVDDAAFEVLFNVIPFEQRTPSLEIFRRVPWPFVTD